jgi:hypothetical protein
MHIAEDWPGDSMAGSENSRRSQLRFRLQTAHSPAGSWQFGCLRIHLEGGAADFVRKTGCTEFKEMRT